MTADRAYSDATLDALAAAPAVPPPSLVPLVVIIAKHRFEYQRDLWIAKLTTEEPPVLTDARTGVRSADPMSMLGPTLSHALLSYISGAYGRRFLWSHARVRVRDECRKTHRDHTREPEWRGSLCDQLIRHLIIREYAFERACWQLGVGPERTEPVARAAFARIEALMDQFLAEPLPDEPRPGVRIVADPLASQWAKPHHAVDGLHQEECRQCRS